MNLDLSYIEQETARDAELEKALLTGAPFDQLLSGFVATDAEALSNGKWHFDTEAASIGDAGSHGAETGGGPKPAEPVA